MKTILVPTDFSENADNALYYAIDIAKNINAKIILLNAFYVAYSSSHVPVDFIVAEKKDAKKESETQLKASVLKIKHAGKIGHDVICTEGFAVDEILKAIENERVDLVVMGTKGANDFVDSILGSNTAKVIEKAKCPVIAVPEDASFKAIEKITYATDFNNCDMDALKSIVEIFRSFNVKINVLHVLGSLESRIVENVLMKEFKEEVHAKISYDKLSFQLLRGDDIESSLEKYVDEGNADLLVMSTHHRIFFNKLFGNSVTKHMAYHSSIPLMAFHYQSKSSEKVF